MNSSAQTMSTPLVLVVEDEPGIASVLQGFDESPAQSKLLTAALAAPKARREEEKGAIAELRTLGFVEEGSA